MKLNVDKIRVIVFTGKTCAISYVCRLCDECVTRTDSIEDLGVRVDCKHCFITYTTYVFSQPLKVLELICSYIYSYSATVCFLLLYYSLVRP